jgi:hypothetical protein
VYRLPIQTGTNRLGRAKYWTAPHCKGCAGNALDEDLNALDEDYVFTEPCEGCGRLVYRNSGWEDCYGRPLITACCEICHRKAVSLQAKW